MPSQASIDAVRKKLGLPKKPINGNNNNIINNNNTNTKSGTAGITEKEKDVDNVNKSKSSTAVTTERENDVNSVNKGKSSTALATENVNNVNKVSDAPQASQPRRSARNMSDSVHHSQSSNSKKMPREEEDHTESAINRIEQLELAMTLQTYQLEFYKASLDANKASLDAREAALEERETRLSTTGSCSSRAVENAPQASQPNLLSVEDHTTSSSCESLQIASLRADLEEMREAL